MAILRVADTFIEAIEVLASQSDHPDLGSVTSQYGISSLVS